VESRLDFEANRPQIYLEFVLGCHYWLYSGEAFDLGCRVWHVGLSYLDKLSLRLSQS